MLSLSRSYRTVLYCMKLTTIELPNLGGLLKPKSPVKG